MTQSINTQRVYQQARNSFEAVTGVKAEQATSQAIERWLHFLRAAGRKTNTCRTWLSAIRSISGLNGVWAPPLPKRERSEKDLLSHDQIKALLRVMGAQDKALTVALILCGPGAREWTWGYLCESFLDLPLVIDTAIRNYAIDRKLSIFPFAHNGLAHWLNGPALAEPVFVVAGRKKSLTTQEISRRLKRYARSAGVTLQKISLQTLLNTHRQLVAAYGDGWKAEEALGLDSCLFGMNQTVNSGVKRDPRLHGIGRRPSSSLIRVARKA